MRKLKAFLGVVFLGSASLLTQAASFDCAKATSAVEKMICSDGELSNLDERLNKSYGQLNKAAFNPNLKETQRAWLRQRNRCSESACMKRSYQDRLVELSKMGVDSTYELNGESGVKSNDWPKIDKMDQQACKEAIKLASDTFKSDSMYLFSNLKIDDLLSSQLVLGANNLDISGGDSLVFKREAFDKIPNSSQMAYRSTYWQLKPKYKNRLALKEVNMGWRGDMYSLYVLSKNIKPEEFLADTNIEHIKLAPLISDSWRPPLVFQNVKSRESWLIDVGQPFQFLSNWSTYVEGQSGLELACTIQFRPDVAKAIALLPIEVRELEQLLDETMGSGSDEGTLQPTARLRVEVEHIWANVAMRPWVSGNAYNTRSEVDFWLEDWSEKGPSYKKIYQRIKNQYPIAERALALYYQKHFGKSADEARSLSSSALDVAFRAHYTFSRL